MAYFILRRIRNVFISLHQDTDSAPTQFSASTGDLDDILLDPSSYPVCKVPDHRSRSTPSSYIHDDDGVSETLARAVPYDPNIPTASVPSLTTLNPPSSSPHAPLPVNGTLTDALPLDNQILVQGSTQVIDQTTTEGRRSPTISLRPVIEPSRTTRPSMSSPSLKSNVSVLPDCDIAMAHIALNCAPSDDINTRSSPSPTPVLDAGLFSFKAATRSDLSFVYSSNCR